MSTSGFCLSIGDNVPDVVAIDQSQKTFSFKGYTGSEYLFVFFYPRAKTPGCTAQNKSLRDNYKTLKERGVEVVGVSTDPVAKQKDFHTSLGLPFNLLSDEKEIVAKAFGVPVRFGFANRQAVLLRKGKVVWIDENASTDQQAADVLKAIASLKPNK
jgi:peroxiredoxin Q/BCP